MIESAASPPEIEESRRHPKLAERLANRIAARIARENLPEGEALGSEADLVTQLAASRWTVREALSMLEREGIISVRRGRYGGIFVAAPTASRISGAIRSYLEFIRVDTSEIVETRRLLDEAILERVLARLLPSDVARLRSVEDLESAENGLHAGMVQYAALLDVARSPVLLTFVRAVGELGISAILRSTLSDAALDANIRTVRLKRREQIEAIIAGKLGAALTIETEILETTEALLLSARPSPDADTAPARLRALHLFGTARRFKRPELLMQEIASDIVARGWPIGAHLGTENELLVRYGVSRSAFREAVRALEQIGVVEMRTGRRSGLKVGSPDPETVVANSRRQFARMGVSRQAYREAFDTVAAAAAGFAAQRHAGTHDLTALAQESSRMFFNAVGDCSGNRILALLVRILTAQDRETVGDGEAPPYPLPLDTIAAAIGKGDEVMARRLMLSLSRFRGDTDPPEPA